MKKKATITLFQRMFVQAPTSKHQFEYQLARK